MSTPHRPGRGDQRTSADAALDVEDFEVIHHGDPVHVTYDCVRAP